MHLTGLDQLLDRAGDLLDGHLRVDPVLVEQVDGLGAQPAQRTLDRGADVLRPAGDAGLLTVLVKGEAELRRDDDAVADRLQRLADQLLVVERAVHLGRVEEGDATVDRRPEEGDHLLAWRSGAEGLAHSHAAEAERGHLQGAGAEGACLHGASPHAWVEGERRTGQLKPTVSFACGPLAPVPAERCLPSASELKRTSHLTSSVTSEFLYPL